VGDRVVDRLARYAAGLRFEDLPPEAAILNRKYLIL
jgi:hypothetical protein